ncbi:MAG: PorT family protein [Eudoraea sp.]|nr:PorT family protein [Eudoraea sp.]
MKKLIFLSLLAVLALSSCATTHYGFRGGLNLANINGDDTDNLSTRSAIFFGGFGEFGVTDKFAIQPEVLFSQQGAEYEDSESGGEFYDGRFKLDYINVPVLAKVYVADGFFFEAGPQVGILLSAKDEYDSPISGEDDIKDFIKSTDFSGNVGLGYQLDMGLNFNARYNFGLSSFDDFEDVDENLKNGVISIGVGFRF